MEKFLWRFFWNCRRQGSVEGLFVATEDEVNSIIGNEIYFGEILGKHSEVYGTIEDGEITKVDLDYETVEKVSKILGSTWSGYNPFDYVKYHCPICSEIVYAEEFSRNKRMCYDCADKV